MTKRVWSLLLALALCLSLLPAPALATEGTDDNTDAGTTTDPVAEVTMTASSGEIRTETYTDLIDAFEAARRGHFGNSSEFSADTVSVKLLKHGETYTLSSEENVPISFEYNRSVTVDLNGCTLKRSVSETGQGIMTVKDNTNVTLMNGMLDLTVSNYNLKAIDMPNNGGNPTLTLEGMTINVTGTENPYSFSDSDKYYTGIAIYAGGGTLNIKGGTYGEVQIHSATVNLSGGSYTEVEHQFNKYADLLAPGYIFAKRNDDGSYTYIAPSTMSSAAGEDQNIKNIKVIECTHGGGYIDGKCKQCGEECEHTSVGEDGKCTVCQQQFVAKDSDGKYYASMDEAFRGVADGVTVTMLADNQLAFPLFVLDDENKEWSGKSVKLVMDGKKLFRNTNTPALVVASGKLTIEDKATISHSCEDESPQAAVSVLGGTLELKQPATITGGLKVWSFTDGNDEKHIGTLEGGLPVDTIITKTGANGNYFSVSVEGSENYTQVRELLPEGCAFAKYENGKAGDILDGNVAKLTEDVIVVAHTQHTMTDGVCACGYTCSEHHFANGVCTTCGYKCPHPSDKVSESNGVYTCADCNARMAVKVTNGGTTTYYAQIFEGSGSNRTDSTLKTILNGADGKSDGYAPGGSTITLLTDDLLAVASVNNSRNITLDLNGKNLMETGNGIAVDTGSTLTVTGEGSSSEDDNYMWPCVFNVQGGTLEFKALDFGGTFNDIRVGSGTLTCRSTKDDVKIGTLEIGDANAKVSFKQGTFGKIVFDGNSGSVTLGDLLGVWKDSEGNAVRYDNAFQKADGRFLPYDTEITSSNAIENVKIAICPHGSLHGDNICDYCGMERLVAVQITSDGTSNTMNPAADWTEEEINKAANSAFGTWNSMGGTLKLFTDFTLEDHTITNKYANAIDLNGCNITGGTLTLADGGNVTITDNSEGKNGSFAGVTVNGGATLIVDGVAVDTITATGKTEDGKAPSITLKEGTKFRNINLSGSGLVLADCLESGGCIIGPPNSIISGFIYVEDTGIFTGTVGRIPGTVTASDNTGSIPYNGVVSKNLFPTVTITNESNPKLSYAWYRRTNDSLRLIGTATESNGEYDWILENSAFDSLKTGDKLDAICVITAKNEQNDLLWQTAVTGYELTVAKGTAFVTTAPTAVPNLTYSGSAQNLITYGSGTGGEMQYSTDGTNYSATIPQGTDAKEYTVWYKVVGDVNHEDTEPQQIKVTIAPKEVTISGTGVQASKVYDGTTTAEITSAGTLSGVFQGDELTIVQGTATYDSKDVGADKTVTFSGFTLGGSAQGNYKLTAQPAFVTAAITKAASTVSAAPTAKTLTYNGSAQELVTAGTTADGTMRYSLSENGEYTENIPTGTKAGEYTVWYKVAGDGNHNDSTPVSVSVTIAKAQATVTAKDKTAYVNSTAPDLSKPELDKDYTVSGLFGGDKLTTAPTLNYVDAEGHEVTPDMTKTGEAAAIKASGASAGDNYTLRYENGKLTVSRRSSSSSSGSTTPATPGKTEITTNPDGSIKITPPKSGEKTKVEIPVKDVTPGTVAIIVKPDGTEEIVKDALPTENGLELTVDGSVTVKIVDNAKEFVDTKGHWAEDAIDFVSARGLVNGMTETTFAPNAPTTRAQLWTILARKADADLTGGSTWYEKAQAWAKTSGISDGSDPDGNITRAQMVTMLWRAAGSPAVSGSSSFTDVPGDSYYAQAVAWAAEKGITTGVGDGKFDPNGTCTRAQIATFLYRTYVNKI